MGCGGLSAVAHVTHKPLCCSRAQELRHRRDAWLDAWRRARQRGYGWEELPESAPTAEELDWGCGARGGRALAGVHTEQQWKPPL
jgi:hypothetical protein